MPVRAITFDFWRTLFRETNSEQRDRHRTSALVEATGLSYETAERALKDTRKEFLRVHIEEQRTLLPEDALPMIERLAHIEIDQGKVQGLVDVFATAILDFPPEPIEGALEAVQAAAERVSVGLISDTGISPGRSLQVLLERHGFLDCIGVLSFSDVVGVAKPQRAIYVNAISQLGVAPEELLHIGDLEPTDIQGALAFGAQAALFTGDNERYLEGSQAHHTLRSWAEFTELLSRIL